jgi:3-hydroxy-9,10-secoandrosta-1,3,5(10)-triene-9,17-dione monooxygenase reductase component
LTKNAIAFEGKHFRNALGAFATGVTIVTTRDSAGADVGMTANSFNSVSLDPPMVLWSLAKTSASLPAFMENAAFAVHVLASDQQPLSDKFARRGEDKFGGVSFERGLNDVPLLQGCSARFQCRTAYRYEGGDHVILVGEVLDFNHFPREPLLFHGGKYAKVLPRAKDDALSAAQDVESSYRKDFLTYLVGVASAELSRPVRDRYSAVGLTDEEYFVLTLLMAQPNQTVQDVHSLLALGGYRFTEDMLQSMAEAGYLSVDASSAERKMHLQPKGRELAIEIFAVAKASESAAEWALDIDELKLLKQLLKKFIRGKRECALAPAAAGTA